VVELTGTVVIEPDGPIVSHLPDWVIWQHFVASFKVVDPPVLIELSVEVVDRHPHCRAVTVRARKGGEVKGTTLRSLPVGALLDYAVAAAVMAEDGSRHARFKSPAEFAEFRAHHQHHPRERWMLTPEHLQEVAQVYLGATSSPVQAVARHYNRPRPTASRWVEKAKDDGYIPRPETGRRKFSTPKKKGSKR
jgi:hypothetical protein